MLGLFPRVRCGACGFVNVLLEGAATFAAVPSPAKRGNETVALDENPLYAAVPSYEEPSEVSAPPSFEPSFESPEEPPPYEESADYEQPAPLHGAVPHEGEYGEDVPDLPIESTRISIDPSEENEP